MDIEQSASNAVMSMQIAQSASKLHDSAFWKKVTGEHTGAIN